MFRFFVLLTAIFFITCNQNGQLSSEKKLIKSNELTVASKRLIEINNLDSARILIEQALKLNPNNYVAYNNRALLNAKQNFPQEQIVYDYQKCLELNPDYDIAIYSLASYYSSIKNYEYCIIYADRYLRLSRYDNENKKFKHDMYAVKGESEQYLLQFDKAIVDFKKAIELDSNDKGVHKDLADCYYFSNLPDLAIKEYSKAIQLDSSYFQAYLGRAMIYEASEVPALIHLAMLDYRKALSIDPNVVDIYKTNSSLFMREKNLINKSNCNCCYLSLFSRHIKILLRRVLV